MSLEEEAGAIQYGVDKYKKELSDWIAENMCNKIGCCICEDCGGCIAADILEYMNKEVYEDEDRKRYIRNRT